MVLLHQRIVQMDVIIMLMQLDHKCVINVSATQILPFTIIQMKEKDQRSFYAIILYRRKSQRLEIIPVIISTAIPKVIQVFVKHLKQFQMMVNQIVHYMQIFFIQLNQELNVRKVVSILLRNLVEFHLIIVCMQTHKQDQNLSCIRMMVLWFQTLLMGVQMQLLFLFNQL